MSLLLGYLARVAVRTSGWGRLRYVDPGSRGEELELAGAVLRQIRNEYGVIGPLRAASVSPEVLTALWALLRRTILEGPLPRVAAEVIVSAVSQAESSRFCAEYHCQIARAAGAERTACLVDCSDWGALMDRGEPLDLLAVWARDLVRGVDAEPPVRGHHAPFAVSIALGSVLLATLGAVFLREGLSSGTGMLPFVDDALRANLRREWGREGSARRRPTEPLAGTGLCATGPSFAYPFASSSPSLLETWGLADSLLAQAAQRSLAPEVRSCVEETLRRRYQNAPTLDLRPICEVLPGVSEENRAAARLALLAATAPYRIGPTDLAQAGDAGPCGQRWVDIVAFGAHTRIRALSQVLSSKVVGSP